MRLQKQESTNPHVVNNRIISLSLNDPEGGESKQNPKRYRVLGFFYFQSLAKALAFDALGNKKSLCTECKGILVCGEGGIIT